MPDKYQSRSERRRKQAAGRKKNKQKKQGLFKRIAILFSVILLVGLLVGAGTFAYYAKDAPKLDEQLLIDPIASQLLDKDGNVFTTLGTEKRDYIEFEDIPKNVQEAVLATEDIRFYKHHGIDIRRLAGAVLANFTRGFGAEGGSTLTQQVVKRSFLSDEKTIKRKAQEAWLSIQLENKFTKEQIFEIYVNKIYYSNGIHGIETASKYYFDKTLDELELHEVAFLAGLPQSPNNYNPYKHPDRADKRKNTVLSLMHHHGKISKEEMEKAKNISVMENLVPEKENNKDAYKYDSFVDQVIKEVEALGDYNVFADGLTIHTTLDPKAQEYTEKMLLTDEVIQYPDDKFQAGIVLLDTATGEVRAIGGNRNKDVKRGRNFATQLSDKQPGSTVKPIFDYGPAIEYLGWSTYEQIVDEPYTYTGGTRINNFDNRHLGQMSIREALYRSRNIPALKAFQAVGEDKVKQFAEKLGFRDEDLYESDAIGGGEQHPSPLTMAGAFAAFGNNGMYNKPHTVKKIVLLDGETEIKNDVEPTIAMKDSTAYMVTDMLKDVLSGKPGATGSAASIPGLPIAGKTGTTNYSAEDIKKYNIPPKSSPDSWFAGYTTNYSIAVWTGYEKYSEPILQKDLKIAQQLFKSLMGYVSADIETPDFKMPKSVVRAAVEKGTNPPKKPSEFTPESNIVYELFVRGTEPTEVSLTFDKLDAPAVSGEFHQAENEVVFTWSHPKSGEENFRYDITITADGQTQQISDTAEESYTIADVEPGKTYSISVKASLGSQQSDQASASVVVPSMEEEQDEEEADENQDEPLPPNEQNNGQNQEEKDKEEESNQNGGNSGNQNNNGNNNNNNQPDNNQPDDNNQIPANPATRPDQNNQPQGQKREDD